MIPNDADPSATPIVPHTPPAGSEERRALLHVARAPAETLLGKPLQLTVKALNVGDDWAFLYAEMQSASGHYPDFSDTPLAEASRNGGASNVYIALLRRRQGGDWQVVESAVGPTDAAWLAWPAQTGAPEALFDLGD